MTAVSCPQEGIPMRALEAGSLVCFYTSLGELVTVKKGVKTWELHACLAPSPPNAEGSCRLPYFPAEAVFAVTRNGSKIGFRSLGADGRSLQAVKAHDAPHRVANHNFGSWESWEVLGLDIREVRVVAREDIRKTERQQMHASRNSRSQAKCLERQLSDTDRRLQEMVTASQRQTSAAQHEIEGLQQQLSQAVAGRRSAEAEALRRGATLKQLEHRLGELSSEKDSADDACEHVAGRMHDLETEIRQLRARHADQVKQMQHQQARDCSTAVQAGASALQKRLADSDQQLEQVRLALEQEQKQAVLDKAALQAEMRSAMQARDCEIQGLLADRMRLEAALASIKGQVTSAASPARSDSTTNRPLLRASVDSQTLRGLKVALAEANLNSGTGRQAGEPQHGSPAVHKQLPAHSATTAPVDPVPDTENQQPASHQASPTASTSPDAFRLAGSDPGQQQPLMPHTAPPAQRSSMWLTPPPPIRTPSGLYAMLNPGGTGQSAALYDLLKSADNSPRSSYATPRVLTPNGTPGVAEARVSNTVIWKDSMDSTADSHALPSLPSLPPSSQASMESKKCTSSQETLMDAQPSGLQQLLLLLQHGRLCVPCAHNHTGCPRFDPSERGQTTMAELQPWTNMAVTGASSGAVYMQGTGLGVQPCFIALQTLQTQFEECCSQLATALPEKPSTAADRTRLVQHFGPDAEDVEHMCERYIDEQLPGAVQVPRCEDPRPRFAEFALLEQPSSESLQDSPPTTQVQIVVQGHEEFDDEITLAGSGRVTPYGEVQPPLEHEADSPEGTATGPESPQQPSPETVQEAALRDHHWSETGRSSSVPDVQHDSAVHQAAIQARPSGGLSAVSPGRGEEEAQQSSKQAPPSLTPHRKPANRTAALRSSWSHPASPSNSMGSDECAASKKRSSFLGRPVKQLEDLW
ncbi:hypothetical protein ABBQ32_002416 [Trebouxia sp. C0010 RCD-2024]